MSIADPGPRRRRTSQAAGFTMIEVVVTMGLLTLMALVIERTLASTQQAQRYMEVSRRVKERCESVAYDVYEAVSSSRCIFARDGTGEGYLDALDLTRRPLATGTRLPRPDEMRDLGPDLPGDPHTGNVILFVRETDPLSCLANSITGTVRYVDVHRFVCCYPHQTDRRVVTNGAHAGLDFVIWYSIGYPSYAQLTAIGDADERRGVLIFLYDAGYRFAWDADGQVSDAFYAIGETGELAPFPVAEPTIAESLDDSPGGRCVYADMQLARTDAASAARRAILTVDDPEEWVPNGFEVKVTGASGHRKVWLHLVVEGQAARGREAVYGATLIASVRDF